MTHIRPLGLIQVKIMQSRITCFGSSFIYSIVCLLRVIDRMIECAKYKHLMVIDLHNHWLPAINSLSIYTEGMSTKLYRLNTCNVTEQRGMLWAEAENNYCKSSECYVHLVNDLYNVQLVADIMNDMERLHLARDILLVLLNCSLRPFIRFDAILTSSSPYVV